MSWGWGDWLQLVCVNGTFSLEINDGDDLFMFLYLTITRGSHVHFRIVMKDLSHKGCPVRHRQSLTSGLYRVLGFGEAAGNMEVHKSEGVDGQH